MELVSSQKPLECKALDCKETRINENYCGHHTHKLQPIYLRYKKLESCPPEASDTVPGLLKLYNYYARIYDLRCELRMYIKSECRDLGHDRAIYNLSATMTSISDTLLEITQHVGQIEQVDSSIDSCDETSEIEESEMDLQEIVSYDKKRRLRKEDREPCFSAIHIRARFFKNKMLKVADTAIQNHLLSTRLNPRPPLHFINNAEMTERVGECAFDVLEKVYKAVKEKRDIGGCVAKSPLDECCFKKFVEIIVRNKTVVEIVLLGTLIRREVAVRARKKLHILNSVARYKPPLVIFEFSMPGVATFIASSERSILITEFDHECKPSLAWCPGCLEESKLGLGYKTLPNHLDHPG